MFENKRRYPKWISNPPRRDPSEPRIIFSSIEEYDALKRNSPWTLQQRWDRIRVLTWQLVHFVWLFDLFRRSK